MKKEEKIEIAKKIASVVVAYAIIISALLIFVIPLRIVIIINACSILVYRIIFRGLQFSILSGIILYILAGALMVGVMVLIIKYPMHIHDGVLQAYKEQEFAYNYTDDQKLSFLSRDLRESCVILGISYIISGVWVVIDAVRTDDVLLTFFFVKPISNMGALTLWLMLFTVDLVWLYFYIYAFGVNVVNILYGVLSKEDEYTDDSWNSGGGSSDTYDVIIIKH